MDIKVYKERLKSLGVPENLIDMPAVTAELLNYAVVSDMKIEELDSYVKMSSPKRVKIASCYLKDGYSDVVLEDDGSVNILRYIDGKKVSKVKTDDKGYEIEYEEELSEEYTKTYLRDNGIIRVTRENKNSGIQITKSYFDSGNYSLRTSCVITPEDKYGKQIEFNEELLWIDFDSNKERILRKYPHLESYLDDLKCKVKERIQRENSSERKKEAEENEEKNLFNECKRLADKLEEENELLGIYLDFIEKVKKHPLGRVLFRKHLNTYKDMFGKLSIDSVKEENTDKQTEKEGKENKSGDENRLESLRKRKATLDSKLKRVSEIQNIARKSVSDIITDNPLKVCGIYPLFEEYDRRTKEFFYKVAKKRIMIKDTNDSKEIDEEIK